MAQTGFVLNGLNLRNLAMNITVTSGWDGFPGMKFGGNSYVFTHGEDLTGRKFYQARDIELHMIFLATTSTGTVTTTPLEHLQDNIDSFLGALHDVNPLVLTRTMPDATTRVARVRPIQFIPIEDAAGITRSAVTVLRMGYPFWEGAVGTHTGGTATLAIGGNAPINNMELVFTTSGRITHNSTGNYVESSAAGVTLDVGTGVVTGGDSGAISTNRPWYIQFEPGNNGITVTGGNKTINWNEAWF